MAELECGRAYIGEPIEPAETDSALCAQLALKMAALLPSDPEQGERVLDLLAKVYHCISDQASRPRPGRFDG